MRYQLDDISGFTRILVLGNSGSGKTTLARDLGNRLGLAVYHLDSYYWLPGWKRPPDTTFSNCVKDLCSQEQWIIEGNYPRTLSIRVQSCDLVITLECSPLLCIFRILSRYFARVESPRYELPLDCPERVSFDLIWKTLTFKYRTGALIVKILGQNNCVCIKKLRYHPH